jgi:hypothetical protein
LTQHGARRWYLRKKRALESDSLDERPTRAFPLRRLLVKLRIAHVLASLPILASHAAAQHPIQVPPGGPVSDLPPVIADLTYVELAGRTLATYPFFEYDMSFFEGSRVEIALDPTVYPSIIGRSADVWIVPHDSPFGWTLHPQLVDVRAGGPTPVTFQGGSVLQNIFTLDNGLISGFAGTDLGVPFDVVLDFDHDGRLSPGDWMDGNASEAGFYVLYPTALAGPLAVTEILYSGGTFLGQDLYYPTNIAQLGECPLVIVSHGNGHNYQWYDHIGMHLASYGYIVMSHQNNTMPGIEAASLTTLQNVDYLLGNLGTIAGGALVGHLDKHRQTWMGHSRGGEGVVRAYTRIHTGAYAPINYTINDIVLISSMAPTDFLGPTQTNPFGVSYSLWTGGADNDVNGCADCALCQTFHLHDRATANRQSISLHGVGHGCFHANASSSTVATGPCQVTRNETHQIMRAYLLPLVKRYVDNNIPARDCLWRQWESFHSPGVPTGSCIVVDLMYQPGGVSGDFIVDDFQTETAATTSSSGGTVTATVTNLVEGRLDDLNTDFTANVSDAPNGMTVGGATDTTRGVVFDWTNVDRSLAFEVVPAARDVTAYTFLEFRACQASRHANTTAVLGDLTFTVELHDTHWRDERDLDRRLRRRH